MAVLSGPSGRDRRRKGWVNRLRRLAYGLALACCVPAAQAQDARGDAPRGEPLRKNKWPWMRAQEVLPALANTASAMRFALTAESSTGLLRLNLGAGADASGKPFAFAVGASDMGYLYLNLYSPDGQQLAGKWRLGGDSDVPVRPLSPRDEWLQLRGARDEDTEVVISPQLVLHLDEMSSAPKGMEARLQYAPWSSVMQREGGDRRMPQIVLHWPFWK